MAASVIIFGGQIINGSLITRDFFKMYIKKVLRSILVLVSANFIGTFNFWECPASKNVHRGYHDVFEGQGSLKTQKFVRLIDGAQPRRLDFINRVSHGRRLRICFNFAFWGCPDLRGHHGIARRMHVSYSGPREDVSLKALGGYAPSALQTDILPRSRVGDIYSVH